MTSEIDEIRHWWVSAEESGSAGIAIDRLAAAVPNGELMAAADPVALLDEAVRLIDAAEQRGYERGLRDGREAERADVVRWLRGYGRYGNTQPDCIERAEHAPTPQGDDAKETDHG